MPENEAVEQGAGGFFILGVELRYGLELKAQIGVRPALVLAEKQ